MTVIHCEDAYIWVVVTELRHYRDSILVVGFHIALIRVGSKGPDGRAHLLIGNLGTIELLVDSTPISHTHFIHHLAPLFVLMVVRRHAIC